MRFPETKFEQVLEVPGKGEIRFIVVGGLAAMAHGNARSTYDVDVVYSRDRENIRKLANVVGQHQHTCVVLRMACRLSGMRKRSEWD